VNIGTHTVTVSASSGSTVITKSAAIAITQGGPPLPANTYAITGATINPFNGQYEVSAGVTVTFAASEAHATSWAWDFGDGSQATGQTATHAFRAAGSPSVTLTVTGDGTNNQGTNSATIRFTVTPPSFQALMIPGAGSILDPSGDWATDLSVTNPGTQPMTITLLFVPFSNDIPSDLSTLPFDSLNSVPLAKGQSWSGVDVVGSADILNEAGAGKGILLLKFEGGNATPIATARVYFTSQGSSFGTALPSFVVGPYGAATAQAVDSSVGQMLIGLRDDSLYRFNISLFNASGDGGLFHVDAFSEDGTQVATRDFAVPPYSQAGVNDTDMISSLDPSKRYILKATSTAGGLQAYASSLDRRNNDLVQVSDDTPRFNVPPDTQVSYYMPGVGRIEDEASNAHWRTDLRFYNPSTLQRTVFLEFHYTPTDATTETIVTKPLSIGAKQGISIDDVVGNFLDDATDADLKTGTVLGLLKVFYNAPPDVATAPLIIGGRIYADLSTGTAGMQLSVYTDGMSVGAGSAALIMPGAQTNLRFRTNIGLFALGTLPTTVRIHAIKQDGTEMSTYDFTLNDGSHGAFAQIPMTALPSIDGNPMTMRVEVLNGSRVGAYIVTVDQISADTVFIQGKPIS
jgi:PKD repeat protein